MPVAVLVAAPGRIVSYLLPYLYIPPLLLATPRSVLRVLMKGVCAAARTEPSVRTAPARRRARRIVALGNFAIICLHKKRAVT